MNFRQMQDTVLTLSKRRNEPAERELVKQHLNDALSEVCQRARLLHATATVTLTSDVDYNLAALGIDDLQALLRVTYTGTQSYGTIDLERVSLGSILDQRTFINVTPGYVSTYALDGDTLRLSPGPLVGETLTLYYVREPVLLDDDEDTPELLAPADHRVVVHGAMAEAAPDAAVRSQFEARFEKGVVRIEAWAARRGGDRSAPVRIGYRRRRPHDPSWYGSGW